MATADGADELYTVKNAFWLGNFDEAIAEAKALRLSSEAARTERDVYLYRSHIGLGNCEIVMKEVRDESSTPAALQAIKLLASYIGKPSNRSVVMLTLEDWLADAGGAGGEPTLQLVAGIVQLREGNYENALRAVKAGATMEQIALSIQILLHMDRVDAAEKALVTLAALDDDTALYHLSAAHVYLALGGEKTKEASLILKDLIDRHGPSLASLNALACAYISWRRYDDAQKLLQEALIRAPNDADTLINFITLAMQTGKSAEAREKYLPTLREVAPQHAYVLGLERAEANFDRVAAGYAPS